MSLFRKQKTLTQGFKLLKFSSPIAILFNEAVNVPSISKKDVDEKNSKYFAKAPYKCQNELEEFMVDDVWTLESINKRRDKLLTFAKELWCNFDFVKELQ